MRDWLNEHINNTVSAGLFALFGFLGIFNGIQHEWWHVASCLSLAVICAVGVPAGFKRSK